MRGEGSSLLSFFTFNFNLMNKKTISVDKVYKLKRDISPLSLTIPSRNTKRFPLLHFDGQYNRPLRYAVNQKSPFEDEQDDNAILEPVIFENGFLSVSKKNPVLQEFLHYHPQNGMVFVEVNTERDAQAELDVINYEVDALIAAKSLDIADLERVARVMLGKDVSRVSTAELKRDVLIYAKTNPQEFLNILDDPMLNLQADVSVFFENGLLGMRNNNKDVYFNLPNNKKRMLTVPFGEDYVYITSSYLQSDEGLETLKLLEKHMEE